MSPKRARGREESPLGPHPADWRQLAMQNVILASIGSGTLHGEKIGYAFEYANNRIVTLGGSANFAFARLAQVTA